MIKYTLFKYIASSFACEKPVSFNCHQTDI